MAPLCASRSLMDHGAFKPPLVTSQAARKGNPLAFHASSRFSPFELVISEAAKISKSLVVLPRPFFSGLSFDTHEFCHNSYLKTVELEVNQK